MKKEVKRSIAKGGYFREETYPFVFKITFLTLAVTIEIKPNIIGSQISSVLDDSLRDLLGFDSVVICKKSLSTNPVEILSFDKSFLETDIAQGNIFKCKRTGIVQTWKMGEDRGF